MEERLRALEPFGGIESTKREGTAEGRFLPPRSRVFDPGLLFGNHRRCINLSPFLLVGFDAFLILGSCRLGSDLAVQPRLHKLGLAKHWFPDIY